MKLGAMQPYFLPYIGYYQLIKAVDQYVVCDDLNYIKNGWINRNNILIQQNKWMFTIKLKKASQNKLINEIEILDDFSGWIKTIQHNYKKAPYYADVMELLAKIISYEDKCLSKFIINSLNVVLDYLQIKTPIVVSSCIEKKCSLKNWKKVIDICQKLGSNEYINAIGGQNIYKRDAFASYGIDLKFIKTEIVPYKQYNNEFIPNMSILDVMMFNSVEEINDMLDRYILI